MMQNVQVVYAYHVWNGNVGLAVFTTADYAANFVAVMNQRMPGCISGMSAVPCDIDYARDIALHSPIGINGEVVNCLLLSDQPDRPEVMWIGSFNAKGLDIGG
jgi:hypothetical protein